MPNRVKEWTIARAKLKPIYEKKGITTCEIRLIGCKINNFLGFAHRHKRRWYYSQPELLGAFNQTLLGCNHCHDIIEDDKEATELLFKKLRDDKEDKNMNKAKQILLDKARYLDDKANRKEREATILRKEAEGIREAAKKLD